MKPEFDEISGRHTTGHEWNGIKELDTPIPKAFRIWLWSSIAVAALFWVLYPAWPWATGYTRGLLGYASRTVVAQQVDAGKTHRTQSFAPFKELDVTTLAQDPTLRARYEPSIAVLFCDNCAACHGRDASGRQGFPNLTDKHWLWSDAADEIEATISVGINAAHDETRYAQMPAFGRDELLGGAEIDDVVEYVLRLSGQGHDALSAERGGVVFEENCASCHAEGGTGGYENGAPSLADAAWIYGGDRVTLRQTLENGRAGVMPAWSGRLTEAEIRQLTLYLIWRRQTNDDT